MLSVSADLHGQKQKSPLWMKDPAKAFDNKVYLYATGEGSDKDKARKNAIRNLSAKISSEVKSVSEIEVSEKTSSTTFNNEKSVEITEFVESFISKGSVTSENKLFNVNYSYFENKKKNFHYAIAYFKKNETIEVCKATIKQNNGKINSLQSMDVSILKKYTLLKQAFPNAKENEQLLDLLTILNPAASGNIKVIRYHDLQAILEKLSEQITFAVSSPEDDRLKIQLESFITGLGYTLSENPAYTLQGDIKFIEQDRMANMKTVRWILDVKLYHQKKVVGTYTVQGLKDHITYEEAKLVIYRKLSKKLLLNPEFKKDLLGE